MTNIVGIPAGKMIRTSVISDTDDLGLTRLTETYAFATSEFQTFRTRLINLTPYNTVMNCVYPTPTTTYPYVVIENASVTEDVGGISMATVQYVGILKPTRAGSGDISWLPPAKQRLQPIKARYNNVSVIVDFVYYVDVEPKDLKLIDTYGTGTSLPVSINGTNLYRGIIAPFVEEQKEEIVYRRSDSGGNTSPPIGIIPTKTVYLGMLCVSHFSERVGLFYKVTNTYQDSGFEQGSFGYVPYGYNAI